MAAPQWPVAELPATARAVEAAGFDELWFAEDCFLHGGLTAAATALAVTERLKVGVGLLPAAVRNPAIAAMEIATLGALHPGRVEVAFGHGVEAWMRQIGARPPDRLVALEEVVRATRALLHGETVTTDGASCGCATSAWSRRRRRRRACSSARRASAGSRSRRARRTGWSSPRGRARRRCGGRRSLLGGGTLVAYTWLRIGEDARDGCRRSCRRGATAACTRAARARRAPAERSTGSRSPARPRTARRPCAAGPRPARPRSC